MKSKVAGWRILMSGREANEFDRHIAESRARVVIVNPFAYLGMPKSVRAGQIAPAV
ncbi:MAG TPA: hypothetical protein PLI90_11040 [Rhodocyclaceae bacterium]|jgi:hypothetical protein|nr:hypothetical protein [Rhodocyclaceae bacterium]